MWDYSFAIPSLLILGLLMSNYFLLKRLPLRVNRSFVELLIIEAVVISTDIISSWTCEEYRDLPRIIVILTNMVFFIFFAIRGHAFFAFTCSFLGLDPSEKKLRTFLCQLPLIINELVIISSPWTKAVFFIDDNGYHRGKYYMVIVFVFFFYVFFSAYVAMLFRKNIKRIREGYAIAIYLILLCIGLICRTVIPRFLLMDTFCIMAILTITLVFMNPDFYIDIRTRLFNTEGITAYLNEMNSKKHSVIAAFVINHYEEVVEIYGRKQMDKGLGLIGFYLKKNFPDTLLFYYRSGRFIIIARPDDDMDEILEKIENRFHMPWTSDDTELYLNVSCARINCNCTKYSSDAILNVLANALEFVSNTENETYIINENQFEASEDSITVKRALEKAIENNSVEIFLQPIVDAHTYDLVGAESLCRIRDDSGNIIPPGKFISIAENNGRINQLGEQVFENTCKFISQNNLSTFGMQWINVNLSTAQFMKNDLAHTFENFTKTYNVNPAEIHLEITEAAIIDESIMKSQIQEIQKIGFVFALDDYGTGYSNASRLKHFPFINVKIDMSLVWDYCAAPDQMLPMLIETLKSNGYSITAEGIETIEMAKAMTEIGCDYLQGWYFSKPIPPNEFISKYKKS
ncbi:MAG: EAL domain-containing protein [Pseudobutyrivibrio sp.]|nr:EAL domain-containing protein [Pseudobutyrivibrio sp.]